MEMRAIHIGTRSTTERRSRTWTFLRHLFEMTVAMMLGMCVLGMAFRGVHTALFGGSFADTWREHTGLAVFAMTFNMTMPMVAWMHHRGHAWDRCWEMGGAMFGLGFAVLVPFWLGIIPAGAALPLEMALMIPVMVLVMLYRLDEYTGQPPRLVAAP
jgi:hypothetical protein